MRVRTAGTLTAFSYTEITLIGRPCAPANEGCTLQLDTRQYADTLVAAPAGRIDHRTAAELESALTPLLERAGAGHAALVLDLSAVEYISSVGLRVLMIAARQMRERQAKLSVAALQSVVAEIFTISRFDKLLVVCATLEDALAHSSDAALAAYRAARNPAAP
jgi:anti-anti-sigma factor